MYNQPTYDAIITLTGSFSHEEVNRTWYTFFWLKTCDPYREISHIWCIISLHMRAIITLTGSFSLEEVNRTWYTFFWLKTCDPYRWITHTNLVYIQPTYDATTLGMMQPQRRQQQEQKYERLVIGQGAWLAMASTAVIL